MSLGGDFMGRYWTFRTAKDELMSGIAYLCFAFSLLAALSSCKDSDITKKYSTNKYSTEQLTYTEHI